MKKGLFRTSLFLTPILLIFLIMEIFLRQIPNTYQLKRSFIEERGKDIETLILGHSHHYYGLNPEYMGSGVFNAAHVSQMYNFDKLILEKYLTQMQNIKNVIIPISYHSLYDEGNDDKFINKNYVLYYGLPNQKGILERFELASGPIKGNVNRIVNFISESKDVYQCNSTGFGLDFSGQSEIGLLKSAKISAQRHFVENIEFKKKNFSDLIEIIEKGKEKKINIILLSAPVSKDYYSLLDKKVLDKIKQATDELVKMNNNIYYLDLRQDQNFQAEDFYDADHLNIEGAKKLSIIVAEFLKNTPNQHHWPS